MAAPVVAAVLAFMAKKGIKAAVKKYGKKTVDNAKKVKQEKRNKKSKMQENTNRISEADTSNMTTPRSVMGRMNLVEKKIRDMEELIKQGSPRGNPKELSKLKERFKNLDDMYSEELNLGDVLGGKDSVYGKFSRGGLSKTGHTDYRKKGMFS